MIGHNNNKTKGTNNAPIPEDNEQYCFRMPLKLEVHKRYWTTPNNHGLYDDSRAIRMLYILISRGGRGGVNQINQK